MPSLIHWTHTPPREEPYPRETRLVLIPRLIELGFTKEDIRCALELSHIQVVKDDLHILRGRHVIGSDLKPVDFSTRLQNAISLCAHLEGQEGTHGLLRSILLSWMSHVAPKEDVEASFVFPTMVGQKGDVIPITFERRRHHQA